MKLSISKSKVWEYLGDEFDFYTHIRECGFRYIDYSFFSELASDEAPYMQADWEKRVDETRNRMEKIGVRALVGHAPGGEPSAPGMTENLLRWTKRAIECCAVLGIQNLAYHPGAQRGMTRKEYLDFNIEYVRQLLPTLEKCNVTLALENVGRWDEPFYCHNAEEMLDLINAIDHPLYQACLDTGHLSLQDGQQYETITQLGSHLRSLHVQDNYGSLPVSSNNRIWRQDLHLPPLMGSVNFDEVMIGLKKIGYSGLFNLEPESPRCNEYSKDPRVRHMTLDLTMEYYCCVHDIAEHILKSYDVYEE